MRFKCKEEDGKDIGVRRNIIFLPLFPMMYMSDVRMTQSLESRQREARQSK